MKTSIDNIDLLFPIINVVGVTGIIDGGVYKFDKPLNSELQDVVLTPLVLGGSEDIQNGTVMINIFCKKHTNGAPNLTKLNQITTAVLVAIKSYTGTSGTYFDIEPVNENVFTDINNPQMNYVSIRLSTSVES